MNLAGSLSLISFVSVLMSTGHAQYHDAVFLGDVKTLTLYKGQYTSHRRQPPIPQLQCIGGTAGCSYTPDVVQCVNMGSDGVDYQWECKSELEKKVRFGKIVVSCEGYSSPNDPYVLKGSCGLEYSLELTGSHASSDNRHSYNTFKGPQGSGESVSYVVIIIFVVAIIAAMYWFSSQNQAQPSDPHAPPPYSSGNPPPYGFNNQSPPGFTSPPPSYGFKSNSYGQPHATNQGGFGGFWTGAGVGGLLGYLFGSRNNNPCQSGYSTYSRPHDRSFFGGTNDFGPSTSTGFRGSTSSESRTTSGFGGTKRR